MLKIWIQFALRFKKHTFSYNGMISKSRVSTILMNYQAIIKIKITIRLKTCLEHGEDSVSISPYFTYLCLNSLDQQAFCIKTSYNPVLLYVYIPLCCDIVSSSRLIIIIVVVIQTVSLARFFFTHTHNTAQIQGTPRRDLHPTFMSLSFCLFSLRSKK